MPAQCNTKPLEFEPRVRRRVVADFGGGPIASDAGLLLLRRVDRHLSVVDQVADCFADHRDPRADSVPPAHPPSPKLILKPSMSRSTVPAARWKTASGSGNSTCSPIARPGPTRPSAPLQRSGSDLLRRRVGGKAW